MGETITFWVLAVVSVGAALGMVFNRKAVYSALMAGRALVSLAVRYALQDRPFLAGVQLLVCAGAIMMPLLVVLMLVAVGSAASLAETLKGRRLWAPIAPPGFVALIGTAIGTAL